MRVFTYLEFASTHKPESSAQHTIIVRTDKRKGQGAKQRGGAKGGGREETKVGWSETPEIQGLGHDTSPATVAPCPHKS